MENQRYCSQCESPGVDLQVSSNLAKLLVELGVARSMSFAATISNIAITAAIAKQDIIAAWRLAIRQ